MNEELELQTTQPEVEMSDRKRLENRTLFGFWIYILTDCVLFSVLFATYAVLHNNTNGAPAGKDLFSLPYVLAETLLLLTSSFTAGLALLASRVRNRNQTIIWLIVTFVLGLTFVSMEFSEFHRMVADGNSWRTSGFLSSYFTLVSTHGLHISAGLLWILTLLAKITKRGFTSMATRQIQLFTMFWHFLDVVWIFIFSIVYLMGAM